MTPGDEFPGKDVLISAWRLKGDGGLFSRAGNLGN